VIPDTHKGGAVAGNIGVWEAVEARVYAVDKGSCVGADEGPGTATALTRARGGSPELLGRRDGAEVDLVLKGEFEATGVVSTSK